MLVSFTEDVRTCRCVFLTYSYVKSNEFFLRLALGVGRCKVTIQHTCEDFIGVENEASASPIGRDCRDLSPQVRRDSDGLSEKGDAKIPSAAISPCQAVSSFLPRVMLPESGNQSFRMMVVTSM